MNIIILVGRLNIYVVIVRRARDIERNSHGRGRTRPDAKTIAIGPDVRYVRVDIGCV